MSERRESILAVSAAADDFMTTCAPHPQSFRLILNYILADPVPRDFTAMLDQIDHDDRERTATPKPKWGRRHAAY